MDIPPPHTSGLPSKKQCNDNISANRTIKVSENLSLTASFKAAESGDSTQTGEGGIIKGGSAGYL